MSKINLLVGIFLIIPLFSNAQNPDFLYQQFSKGYDDLDANAIANLYTKDASVLYLYQGSNPTSYKGRTAILGSFKEFFDYTKKEDRTMQLVFKIIDRQPIGSKIMDIAYYQLTIKIPNQDDFIDYGKIATELQKEEGEWKFCTDASSTATKEEFEKAIPIKDDKEMSVTNLSDEDLIRNINDAYQKHWLKNDEEGVMRLFTEDARISPNSLAPVDSLHNIKKFWFPNDGSTTIIHHFDTEEMNLAVEDDIAFATQKTMIDFSYEKAELKMGLIQKGINTSVYKRQKDGSWKIWRKSWIDYEMVKK